VNAQNEKNENRPSIDAAVALSKKIDYKYQQILSVLIIPFGILVAFLCIFYGLTSGNLNVGICVALATTIISVVVAVARLKIVSLYRIISHLSEGKG